MSVPGEISGDGTFLTATSVQPNSGAGANVGTLIDVTRMMELPPEERRANLERYTKCISAVFRRRKATQEEIDLQFLMPSCLSQSPDVWEYTSCAICLCDFAEGEELRRSPCAGGHAFHPKCLRGWMERSHATCPVCRGGAQDDGRIGRNRQGGGRSQADALAEFVTRRMRSGQVDFTISKTNHTRADKVMKQLKEPNICLKPEEEPSSDEEVFKYRNPMQRENKKEFVKGDPSTIPSIYQAAYAARKAEKSLERAMAIAEQLDESPPPTVSPKSKSRQSPQRKQSSSPSRRGHSRGKSQSPRRRGGRKSSRSPGRKASPSRGGGKSTRDVPE
eukprot:TRINITY_DN13228_c0_g1_i1.p1 TRINITY_DN13228_c0_g1~~TRINITY_DN13228_c0_g1_i1.p1  ORF type:complete len:358 (+),score=71.35 TRINITY_DN13228_c0_g1_i1:78-1076(+)